MLLCVLGSKKRSREKRRSRPSGTDRNQSRERIEERSREKNQDRNGKEHAQESDRYTYVFSQTIRTCSSTSFLFHDLTYNVRTCS